LVTRRPSDFSKLIECFAMDFWLKIFANANVHKSLSISRKVSILVSQICEHAEDVEWAIFEKFTSAQLLPHIDWRAAISLLQFEANYVILDDESNSSDDAISDLQDRCAYALANEDQEYVTKDEIWTDLEDCFPKLLGRLYKYKGTLAPEVLGLSAGAIGNFQFRKEMLLLDAEFEGPNDFFQGLLD
jgi:hypothetical protein